MWYKPLYKAVLPFFFLQQHFWIIGFKRQNFEILECSVQSYLSWICFIGKQWHLYNKILGYIWSTLALSNVFKFKHIYFKLIEKQVLTTYSNLSRFCFLGTTPVLAPNVWANEKNPKVDNRSRKFNSGPQDCEADALYQDHRHQVMFWEKKLVKLHKVSTQHCSRWLNLIELFLVGYSLLVSCQWTILPSVLAGFRQNISILHNDLFRIVHNNDAISPLFT